MSLRQSALNMQSITMPLIREALEASASVKQVLSNEKNQPLDLFVRNITSNNKYVLNRR
jgi:hypothetical protein